VRARVAALADGSPFAADLLGPERVLAVPSTMPIGATGAAALVDDAHARVSTEHGDTRQETRDQQVVEGADASPAAMEGPGRADARTR
jgi:hypothetical protein